MEYVSTRGNYETEKSLEVLFDGLAPDGGLYLPKKYPKLSQAEIQNLAFKPYIDIAKVVLAPYIKNETKSQFKHIIEKAYWDMFDNLETTLIKKINHKQFVLELFHGPTMSFKDIAMQFLAPMIEHLTKQPITIIGATSGDTGSAAIHAFKNNRARIFILFPHGKISDIQKWQMTGVNKKNVHPIAINGNFDDCQNIVKQILADRNIESSLTVTTVNSINWGRIIAQTVYYFYAASKCPNAEKINFVVPTGNFGNIFAGYVAKKMGLNINKLIIATNENDILARTLKTGRYEVKKVKPTSSPSMDIQVSSNFERLLFEASDRDADYVKQSMDSLKQNGAFELTPEVREKISTEFDAGSASQSDTKKQIKKLQEEQDYLIDPHTAVGVHVAQSFKSDYPTVILATASPRKFPEVIKAATGVDIPKQPKPETKKVVRLDNNIKDVEDYIIKNPWVEDEAEE